MKSLAALVLLIFSWFVAVGQDWAKVPTQSRADVRLKPGDKMPSTELHNMINYPRKTLKFSDHKPKLIILDFWATTCGPCIKFWPTALKLQKEFDTDLLIISVNNYEDTKQVERFLERRQRIDGFFMSLPTSCRDSTIWKNFDGGTLPRYAWIQPDGTVGSITSEKEVNRENIAKWLSTGPFEMSQLLESNFYNVIPNKPIFVNANGGEKTSDVFLWSSSLSIGQKDNTADATIYYDSLEGYGITLTNSPIISLYGKAYNNRLREFDYFDYLPLSRTELVAKDTMKYFDGGALGANTFNYQLISNTPQTRQRLLGMMQDDLRRYFGLEVTWLKKTKKCLVLSMFDSTLATKTKGLGFEAKMRGGDLILDSLSIKTITTLMEMGSGYYRRALYPIVDETGYKGVITGIREKVKNYDPNTLDKIFLKHGLRFTFEMREVDILVLKEPETSN